MNWTSKFKNFYASKDIINTLKRKPMNREKICKSYLMKGYYPNYTKNAYNSTTTKTNK